MCASPSASALAPEYVFSAAGIARLDAQLEAAGLLELAMEEAGRAIAHWLLPRLEHSALVLLLAGKGANGGDALVAARHLYAAGVPVRVLALGAEQGQQAMHPLTAANAARLEAVGVPAKALSAGALAEALAALGPNDWVADGLLGTGLRGALRGELAEVAATLNARQAGGPCVLAIDLPTGQVVADAEATAGVVRADATLALCGYKPAHLFGAAARGCGQVSLAPLPVPQPWLRARALAERPSDAVLAALLPTRAADAHKGTAGRVWVVGGSAGMEGAPLLAGRGALRAGAGLVTLHSAAELPLLVPELMRACHTDLGAWLGSVKQWPDALALGMGLGVGGEASAAELAAQVLEAEGGPALVVDADALQPALVGRHLRLAQQVIFTPHPGEAARLLGCTVSEVTARPLEAARKLHAALCGESYKEGQGAGGVVVLKGGPTVIAGGGGRLAVSRGGHAGMASAGMGDTLAGVLAALLAGGLGAWDAACVGVRLHARAGERAARRFGYGLSASDVADELGGAWADLQRQACRDSQK